MSTAVRLRLTYSNSKISSTFLRSSARLRNKFFQISVKMNLKHQRLTASACAAMCLFSTFITRFAFGNPAVLPNLAAYDGSEDQLLRQFFPAKTHRSFMDAHEQDFDRWLEGAKQIECVDMRGEAGTYAYRPTVASEGQTCGLYLSAAADKKIEVEVLHVSPLIDCDTNIGVVEWFDGWEMGGQTFPPASSVTSPAAAASRTVNICHKRSNGRMVGVSTLTGETALLRGHKFVSSSNVALIMSRLPAGVDGFVVKVRFVNNDEPCNILHDDSTRDYVMRNFGQAKNCTILMLTPKKIEIEMVKVGTSTSAAAADNNNSISPLARALKRSATQMNKTPCRNSNDVVAVSGGSGLDTQSMTTFDEACGVDASPQLPSNVICETTAVTLVSSGAYDNAVAIKVRDIDADQIALQQTLGVPAAAALSEKSFVCPISATAK